MTTYPDFIEKERDNILQKRAELRWKFFEKDGYRKLSDVFKLTSEGEHNYIHKRDEYMLSYYITNTNPVDKSVSDDLKSHIIQWMSENTNQKADINFDAIYDYLDERRKCDDWLSSEEKLCTEALAQFEHQLRNRDTFCLY